MGANQFSGIELTMNMNLYRLIRKSLLILNLKDRHKLVAIAALQVILGFLDLIGVALVGILGSLTVTGVQSKSPTGKIWSVLQFLGLDNKTFQFQVGIIGILAATTLISRTLFSAYFTRKILRFLSFRCASVSQELISKVLSQNVLHIQGTTSQELLFTVTSGVNTVIMGILGSSVSLLADLSLLIIMISGLFIVEPVLAVSSLVFFGGIGLLLYKMMHFRAHTLGYTDSLLNIQSNEKITEVIHAYREVLVRNRIGFYAGEIGKLRQSLASTQAELAFMPNVSKYVIETAMIVSAILVSAWEFSTQDATRAISILTLFLATGARIVPAVLRLQQGSLQLKGSTGSGEKTLVLVDRLQGIVPVNLAISPFSTDHEDFSGEIEIENLKFTYSQESDHSVDDVSISIPHGSVVSIVGPSGAGKSTLVDLLLGVLEPSSGKVSLSGIKPRAAISKWPGAIAYVPQDIEVFSGSLRDNILLGFINSDVPEELCWEALEIAQLQEFVKKLPDQLDSMVGDRGTNLSGGQRQRLGIARALITRPRLLVLDEATSALDGETELNIGEALNSLRKKVTIIMIAHRLSTVRKSDIVIYMDNGRAISIGTFEEVRAKVPNFDRQASLLGL